MGRKVQSRTCNKIYSSIAFGTLPLPAGKGMLQAPTPLSISIPFLIAASLLRDSEIGVIHVQLFILPSPQSMGTSLQVSLPFLMLR